MKKSIFILLFLAGVSSAVTAQNRSIEFQKTRSWNKVVEAAKAANKLIFVDCYTDWCGPCKKLAAEVFTQDKVADFFNENFVNAKFEMEKDADGKAHMSAWGVKAFPTMMFIDPNTEAAVGKVVGSVNADQLIEAGKTALDPTNRLDRMMARYDEGERNPGFIEKFALGLHGAGMEKEGNAVLADYMNNLTLDQMATPEVWVMIEKFENDPLSPILLTVKENKDRFYAIPGTDQKMRVDAKLMSAMISQAIEFATNPNLALYDAGRYNAFVDYLAEGKVAGTEMAAIWLNTSQLSRKGDWKQMLEVIQAVRQEQLLPPQLFGKYITYFMTSLVKAEDKHAFPSAIKWINGEIDAASGSDLASYNTRFQMNVLKCQLYQAAGNQIEAQKAYTEGETYRKLIESLNKK